MPKRKSVETKLKEKRGTGIGPDYVPFYLANEGGSSGTCYFVYDFYEKRQISLLSETERRAYYALRGNPEVEHIREQYPLDPDRINAARASLGLKKVSSKTIYTTDFFVDFADGHQEAYSVKFKSDDFNPDSVMNQARPGRYEKLKMRQEIERVYWESQGVAFNIVTKEDLDKQRYFIKNTQFVLGFWNELFINTTEQKLLYLIAHRIITVPMDDELINPHELVSRMSFDIDAVYEKAVAMRKEYLDEPE